MTARISVDELLDAFLDEGSWCSWDAAPIGPFAPTGELTTEYLEELATAQARSGAAESVRTGEGLIEGRRVALLLGDFDFLAGSIGVGAADLLLTAIARATGEGLPLIASPTSGGTRMQEGSFAFTQMVPIAAAIAAHRAAGLPYLVYLRHPTTGGVFATWGSLGQVSLAQPGALTGFLGPRVYEALYGEPFPDVQNAETLVEHGLLDAVVPLSQLRARLGGLLALMLDPAPQRLAQTGAEEDDAPASIDPASAWDSILRTRDPARPGLVQVLEQATHLQPLSGTGRGERDEAIVLALARFAGQRCVLVGQDRDAATALGPGGLRTARRGFALAAELRLPLVTVIDTPGAQLSAAAELGGLSGEIAHCLAELATLAVPTISIILGQGSGGGALALLPADRILAAANAWLTPLPPEGASAIRFRTPERASEIVALQGVRSVDLFNAAVIDRIIAEELDASLHSQAFCARVATAIADELAELGIAPPDPALRLARYRLTQVGQHSVPALGR